jgi:hypothetical protein
MLSPNARRNGLVVLVLLLLLFILLLFLFLRGKDVVPAPVVSDPVVALPEADEPSPKEERLAAEQERRDGTASLQSASKTFAERYGSYSAEAEFANLRDVLPLMSASLAAQTEAFVGRAVVSDEYYAVTTRVVSVSVNAVDEAAGTAEATVTTQREEARGSQQNVSVRYQDLRLTFVREGDEWKVSSAAWL